MRTVLVFKDTPDERAKLKRMQRSDKYLSVLSELSSKIRSEVKYGDNPNVTWREVQQIFQELLNHEDIYDVIDEWEA